MPRSAPPAPHVQRFREPCRTLCPGGDRSTWRPPGCTFFEQSRRCGGRLSRQHPAGCHHRFTAKFPGCPSRSRSTCRTRRTKSTDHTGPPRARAHVRIRIRAHFEPNSNSKIPKISNSMVESIGVSRFNDLPNPSIPLTNLRSFILDTPSLYFF